MKKDIKLKISSNRSFGIVFFILFLVLSIYPVLKDGNINYYLLLVSSVFLILGIMNSKLLSPLNLLWFKLGIILGKFVSPLVMAMIYFLGITPISLLLKLFKKDILHLKKNDKKTYWINKKKSVTTMKDQF
jgi:hypothetical protein